MAILSLVTGVPPHADVAVGSAFTGLKGGLLDFRFDDDYRQGAFQSAKNMGPLRAVVMQHAMAAHCKKEAEEVGLDVIGAQYLFTVVKEVFPLPPQQRVIA